MRRAIMSDNIGPAQPNQAIPFEIAAAANTCPCLVCGRPVPFRDQHPNDPLITYRCLQNCGEYQASDLFRVAWPNVPLAEQQYLSHWLSNHRGPGKVLFDAAAGDHVNMPRFINWPVKIDV